MRVSLIAAVMALPGIAWAQNAPRSGAACVAAIPRAAFAPVTVLLEASVEASEFLPALPAADLLTESVVQRVRGYLGAESGTLPQGDSVLDWQRLAGQMVVNAHRDGRFTWARNRAGAPADSAGESALALLERALGELSASGERMFWPEGASADSLTFMLTWLYAPRRQNGTPEKLTARVAFPAFSVQMPWMKAPEMRREPRITPPPRPAGHSGTGKLILEFVVDSAGKVDRSRVYEYWPNGAARPTGAAGDYYRQFMEEAMRETPRAAYAPAIVGGCAVDRRVRQQFDYQLGR